ncbi:MAG: nucleotidyltransferase domain-containing protein [bacterium]
MRLSRDQIEHLKITVDSLIRGVTDIRVFGSRLDDSKKGGDLDLLVESEERSDLWRKVDLKIALERALGLPVDVLLMKRGDSHTPFEQLALSKSVPLP